MSTPFRKELSGFLLPAACLQLLQHYLPVFAATTLHPHRGQLTRVGFGRAKALDEGVEWEPDAALYYLVPSN
jgi:hypothetical protein